MSVHCVVHSVEWLHIKLSKFIRLVQSFTEIRAMGFIIKSCRLKPYKLMFHKGRRQYHMTRLFKWWIDEFGNTLIIDNWKQPQVIHNDLRLLKKTMTSTDLYYGLSLDKIAKMSKLVFLVAGKDEDLYQDCCLLNFLGLDNHWRSYLYWYGEWQQVSPLTMGTANLKRLGEQIETGQLDQEAKEDNSTIPCVSGRAWLHLLPADQGFLEAIRKYCDWLLPIFGENR